MRPDDLREWLFQMPFQPFRMYLLESTAFEIHHPELVFVKQSTIDLYFSASHPRTPLVERQVSIALLHITRLELLAPPASTMTDGS